MAQLANINLKNAAAVEQVYTATPGSTPNAVQWFNGSGAWASRFRAAMQWVMPAANSTKGLTKVTVQHDIPYLNPTTGVVDYTVRTKIECFLPVQATQSERDENYARIVDLLADPVVSNALKTYEFPS